MIGLNQVLLNCLQFIAVFAIRFIGISTKVDKLQRNIRDIAKIKVQVLGVYFLLKSSMWQHDSRLISKQ
jgi:hypothetical protein